MRKDIQTDLQSIINDIRLVTDVPVAIGFGIHSPEQSQKYLQIADGVIVGSAIVDIIASHGENAHQELAQYVSQMIPK